MSTSEKSDITMLTMLNSVSFEINKISESENYARIIKGIITNASVNGDINVFRLGRRGGKKLKGNEYAKTRFKHIQ